MAKTQEAARADPDLLAAVVLQTLVGAGPGGLTPAQLARACERDPGRPEEAREIAEALEILVRDELAVRTAGSCRPTRAAMRAAELSF